MFRQYNYFVIKDGAKVMAFTENQEASWTDDPKQAYLFTTHQEAEEYRRKYLNGEFHKVPIVKPWIILYFEL